MVPRRSSLLPLRAHAAQVSFGLLLPWLLIAGQEELSRKEVGQGSGVCVGGWVLHAHTRPRAAPPPSPPPPQFLSQYAPTYSRGDPRWPPPALSANSVTWVWAWSLGVWALLLVPLLWQALDALAAAHAVLAHAFSNTPL